jgi:hypothetical protein
MPFISSVRGNFGPQGRARRGAVVGNFFGDGSDGAVTISSNTNLVVPNKNGSYDGDYVVRQYSTLTINNGSTLTTDQPCKGMLIYVTGNCTINGTLSMRGRGAAADPDAVLSANGIRYPVLPSSGSYAGSLTQADFTGCGSSVIAAVANQPGGTNVRIIQIPKRTTNGGTAVSGGLSVDITGTAGTAGTATGTNTLVITPGGGGSGGLYSDANSCGGSTSNTTGRGGNATAFSGGPGGGGKMSGANNNGSSVTNGSDNGGEGGEGGNGHCGGVHMAGGGVGNPGGWDQYGSSIQSGYSNNFSRADNGTGGIIWLIVGGTLTIGSTGVIDVRGTDNTNYTGSRTTGGIYGGGGASGGGAAILLYKTALVNSGSILTTGGQYSMTNNAGTGGNGGAGSTISLQLI